MVSYTLCLMSKINTVVRIHKGLWFAGGKKNGGKTIEKVQVTCKIKFNCKIKF